MKLKIQTSNRIKILLISILVTSLLIGLNLTGYSKKIKGLFYLVSSPIQRNLWRAGDSLSDFFGIILESKNLKEENEELKLKIQELLSENVVLKEFKEENKSLREALNIGLQKDFKLILTDLISKDISRDYILINKGSKDGLSIGMPAITSQKVLLGKISEVYENFSRVILISNQENSFPAEVQREGATGIIKGEGNFRVSLDKIPLDKEIKEGDIVLTTSLGGIFPKGLLVGEIKKIERSDIKPFQKAEVLPFFNTEELETFFVVTEY